MDKLNEALALIEASKADAVRAARIIDGLIAQGMRSYTQEEAAQLREAKQISVRQLKKFGVI